MPTYKATNGTNSYHNNFADLSAAEAAFASLITKGYEVSLASANEQIPIIVKTEAQKLAERQQFGQQLYTEFILDNAEIAKQRGFAITRQEGKSLKNKADDVLEFVRAGSLELAKQELQELQTDSILTQTRIDKYISMITTFLNNQ